MWPLNQCADTISDVLKSLNANEFRDGFVYFDHEKFHPYSRWFSNHTYQKLVNYRNPQATFEKTKSGFEFLNERISFLWGQLFSFKFECFQDCSDACNTLATRVCRDIPKIVEETAKTGLAKLEENYKKADEKENGTALSTLGKKAFESLARTRELLLTQWVLHLPDPKSLYPLVEGLSSLVESRAKLEEQHENCRNRLRQVTWNPDSGTTVPRPLLQACLQGLPREEGDRPKKGFLRLTANYLRIPSKAQKIPAQGGETHWHPLHPIKNDSGKYEMAKGVAGTCERDGLSCDKLCNLYVEIAPLTFHLVMTCGLIDSDAKIGQLGAAIAHIQTRKPEPFKNGRWVFHSVGSSERVRRLGSRFCNQNALEKQFNVKDLSVLHFHTCFESGKSEASRSFHGGNLENIAFLMEHVLNDAAHLLKDEAGAHIVPRDGNGFLHGKCKELVALANETLKLKNHTNPDKAIDENLEALRKQEKLREELKQMADNLLFAIDLLEKMRNKEMKKNPLPADQSILLFKVMRQILILQSERNDILIALPVGQLECLLLLYRLLDFKVVLTSESGLDEGSVAAAMSDAQSQIERGLYHENIKKKCAPPHAWLMARNKMFDLILKLPERRDTLYRRFSCSEYKGISTANLDDLHAASNVNVRDVLMRAFEQNPPLEKEMLTLTLHYMELVTTHLIREGEKALNSTGLKGLLIENADSLNRMAPFAASENVTLHFSDLSPATKVFDSTAITPIGKAILMDSSALRKP